MYGKNQSLKTKEILSKKFNKKQQLKNAGNLFGFRGSYFRSDCLNAFNRCWRCRFSYNKKTTMLMSFEDPLSGQIIYDFIWNEIGE